MSTGRLIGLADEAATQRLGTALAAVVGPGRILLQGELGAGKTSLARALLHGLGHTGRVKSPTYTLVEPYPHARIPVRHWDLYRINDPAELDALGLREADEERELMLVEWPERAGTRLNSFDLRVVMRYHGAARSAELKAGSARGEHWLQHLQEIAAMAAPT
jgi:tRNA threonylcarbamoyladenosine biosynthesis protein TsaE